LVGEVVEGLERVDEAPLGQEARRRDRVDPVEHERHAAGDQHRVADQRVGVAALPEQHEADHGDQREVEPEVHEVEEATRDVVVEHPGLHVGLDEDPERDLEVDDPARMVEGVARAVDDRAADQEVGEEREGDEAQLGDVPPRDACALRVGRVEQVASETPAGTDHRGTNASQQPRHAAVRRIVPYARRRRCSAPVRAEEG
jgi:hypothetical protein